MLVKHGRIYVRVHSYQKMQQSSQIKQSTFDSNFGTFKKTLIRHVIVMVSNTTLEKDLMPKQSSDVTHIVNLKMNNQQRLLILKDF